MAIMMAAFLCVSIASCSKNDDASDDSIVGTWLCDDDEFIWKFYADGSGLGEEFVYRNGKQQVKDSWAITYVYDSKRSTLVITEMPTDHDYNEPYVYIYDVISLTTNKLILREQGDDDTESFTRQ